MMMIKFSSDEARAIARRLGLDESTIKPGESTAPAVAAFFEKICEMNDRIKNLEDKEAAQNRSKK